MNKEIREYDKNVQFEIGQRIQEMRLDKNMKSIEFILLQILGGSADYILFGKKYEHEIKITKEQKEVLINLINAFNE